MPWFRMLNTVNGTHVTLPKGLLVNTVDPNSTYFYFNSWDPLNLKYSKNICYEHRQGISPTNIQLLTESEAVEVESAVLKHRSVNFTQHTNLRASHSLGSDPEIFAIDSTTEKIIPAFEYLRPKNNPDGPYTIKQSIYPFKTQAYYPDGFAAEFETTPFPCVAYGVDQYHHALKAIHEKLIEKFPNGKLTATPIMNIPQEILDSAPAEHVQLGCSPSFNAYSLTGRAVEDGRQLPLRVSGYHIHVSLTQGKGVHEEIVKRVKMMDRLAGVISVLALQGLEGRVRREYYGLPGEYRVPPYGLEYRTLSGACLWHPAIVHMLTQFARAGVQLCEAGLTALIEASDEEVIETILNLDVDQAKKIVNRNTKVIERLIHHWYRDVNQPLHNKECAPKGVQPPRVIIEELLFKGFMQYIKLDVTQNWHLADNQWSVHSEGPTVNCWRFIVSALGHYEGND